jgi:hypothetical protein
MLSEGSGCGGLYYGEDWMEVTVPVDEDWLAADG